MAFLFRLETAEGVPADPPKLLRRPVSESAPQVRLGVSRPFSLPPACHAVGSSARTLAHQNLSQPDAVAASYRRGPRRQDMRLSARRR
jgi:hypothetical protein